MLTNRYEDALVLASRLHRSQRRKGSSTPYLAHLIGVSSLVLEHGGTEDEAIAALLHDAIEDQGGVSTGEAIRLRFGDTVADIVWACTDAVVIPKPPWRARKEAYLAHLSENHDRVLIVSASDKVYNARSILADFRTLGDRVYDRFTASKASTLWYYRELVTAYGCAPKLAERTRPLVAELDRVVSMLEREDRP
ncbi:MAG: HD domain-containing protein [Myxococcales bacterium]|nr:HD domain-containing protein [Myxococcales bacterium]